MRIGDRVRLLRGTEEGIIVNIKGDKIVEIEIDDGFVIPTMKNEVVVISRKEAETFSEVEAISEPEQGTRQDAHISDGLYIGLVQKEENQYQAYFINQSNELVLYTISQNEKKIISGKAYGICGSFETREIGGLTSSIFNSSKNLNIQVLIYENQTRLKKGPMYIELDLEKKMLSEKVFLESIGEELFLIKIEERPMEKINPEELKEKLFEHKDLSGFKKQDIKQARDLTIDLHIDELSESLKDNEKLLYQLNEFEKAYDNALLQNVEKLKVIHGIGAGILREKIHKSLSAKKEVKFFEDGDKEKFGFGSTVIYF
jgi:hypothetical protein